MKELTIEQKAQRYDEAISMAKKFYTPDSNNTNLKATLEMIFPELKESEGGRIKEELILYLKGISFTTIERAEQVRNWIAWLEKQGKKELVTCPICGWEIEKQGEQKPTDKVKPKFHIGDWVVYCNDNVDLITGVEENGYCINNSCYIPFVCENEMRLWNISDAKDGDMLLSPSTPEGDKECPFIFKEIDKNGIVRCHAALLQSESLKIDDGITNVMGYANAGYHVPAAKEQRDALMKAMANAGYTFDFDKKELKKIEGTTAWSEEDEKILSNIIDCIKNLPIFYESININGEDKTTERFICDAINWLKSLKNRVQPQSRWKPSDEQMRALDIAIRCGIQLGSSEEIALRSLLKQLEDLKKLK